MIDFMEYLNVLLIVLAAFQVESHAWPFRRYCPCICAQVSTPEITAILGPGQYKQVDCRHGTLDDIPSSIPQDTQILLLGNNIILSISDNIDYLYELLYLDLSQNRLTGIYKDDITSNKLLEYINLNGNQISFVSPSCLQSLVYLKHVLLYDNQLPYIPDGFKNLTKLVNLDLSRNQISIVYSNSFRDLRSLQTLNLQRNIIGTVELGSFYQTPKLVTILLNGNMISWLIPQTFSGLSMLQTLTLHDNHLRTLPPRVFETLYNIKTIDLHNNQLSFLHRAAFHGLNSMDTLNLSSNDLRNIQATTFQGLGGLLKLDLSNNLHIGSLPYGLFNGLHNLQSLTLSNVQSFPIDSFSALSQLQSLKLSKSNLRTIIPRLFRDLSRLQILELSDDDIEEILPNSFSPLGGLSFLDLSNNKLKSMNSTPFYGTRFQSLTTLNLQNNQIDKLEAGAFVNLPSLKVLRLDNNSIPVIPNGVFSWQTRLKSISLDTNHIHTIENGVVPAIADVDRLTVVSNYLSCDCHLVNFAQWFQRNWRNVERANEVYCYAPEVYRNTQLLDLMNRQRNPFVCVFPRISTEPRATRITKTIGENVYLHCHLLPTAVATLTWQLPNQLEVDAPALPPLMNHTIQQMANHYGTLVLLNIQMKDAGTYTCTSSNKVGEDRITYHIQVVQHVPVTIRPTIPPTDQPPSTGSNATTTRGPNIVPTILSSNSSIGPVPPKPGGGTATTPRFNSPDNRTGTPTVCTPNPCQNEGFCSKVAEQLETDNREMEKNESESESLQPQEPIAYKAKCECHHHYGGDLCQYQKPHLPTEVTVTASSRNIITIAWKGKDIENTQGYSVLYRIVGENTVIKSVPIHPTVQTYTMEQLESDVSYQICVIAFNQGGQRNNDKFNCLVAKTQKPVARTNSIFNMQLLAIVGGCVAVIIALLLVGYAYQKMKDKQAGKETVMVSADRNRASSSSIAEVFRRSMRRPVTATSSFYSNSDDVRLIDLQGYPERRMYMNPMESRQSMLLSDLERSAAFRDFVPGGPELFPKGNNRKTLKIQDTSM